MKYFNLMKDRKSFYSASARKNAFLISESFSKVSNFSNLSVETGTILIHFRADLEAFYLQCK